jgi:late competence protein required for DNA uptake (superfamily II DNA/RNA helicase)
MENGKFLLFLSIAVGSPNYVQATPTKQQEFDRRFNIMVWKVERRFQDRELRIERMFWKSERRKKDDELRNLRLINRLIKGK